MMWIALVCVGVVADLFFRSWTTARVEVRSGAQRWWLVGWSAPASWVQLYTQRQQSLSRSSFWVLGAIGFVVGAFLAVLAEGDDASAWELMAVPLLLLLLMMAQGRVSVDRLMQGAGSVVAVNLALLTVALGAGGYSWVALEQHSFELSHVFGGVAFWLGGLGCLGQGPAAHSVIESEFRRGVTGALWNALSVVLRVTWAVLTIKIFASPLNALESGGQILILLGALLLSFITHMVETSLPQIRSDHWMRWSWASLSLLAALGLFVRGLGW